MNLIHPHPTDSLALEGPVGVVGAGSVGGWLAAQMQRAGWPVTLLRKPGGIESREETCKKIHIQGGAAGEFSAEVPCVETDQDGPAFRWLFITVKAGDLQTVAKQVQSRIDAKTTLVFPGNGLDLWSHFEGCGTDRFLIAATTYGLYREKPGEISVRGAGGEITVAPVGRFEESSLLAKQLTDAITSLGLTALTANDGSEVIWKKSILSAGLNPVCALLGIENGQLPGSEGFSLANAASEEALSVAIAEGFDLPQVKVDEALVELCEKTATNRCSMLQDLDSGMGTEVDAINGAIVRRGQELKIATPANRLLLEMVSGLTTKTPLKMTVN